MKQVKDKILLQDILLLLSENEYISVSKIASILEVSESTIRRKVEIINDVMKTSGYGCVSKAPRRGLHLMAKNSHAIAALFSAFGAGGVATKEQRIYNYLFLIFSKKNTPITLNEVSKVVFDSIPVARKNLKSCENWLEAFDLYLDIRKNHGISLRGDEGNIRSAIQCLILNNNLFSIDEGILYLFKGLNLDLLKQCIMTMKSKWELKFAEESYQSILIYAAMSIIRSRFTKKNIICGISPEQGYTVSPPIPT